MAAPADLLFAYDSAAVDPNATPVLRQWAEAIRAHWRGGPVVITGHTDSRGTAAYNPTLSRSRATHVAQWLATTGGLSQVPFDIRGKRASEPKEANSLPDGTDNPDGRQRNRRVVVTVPR